MNDDEDFKINVHGIYNIFWPLEIKNVTNPYLSTIVGAVREIMGEEYIITEQEGANINAEKDLKKYIESTIADKSSKSVDPVMFWKWFKEVFRLKTLKPKNKGPEDKVIEAFYPYSSKAVLDSSYGTKGRYGDYGAGQFLHLIFKDRPEILDKFRKTFILHTNFKTIGYWTGFKPIATEVFLGCA